MRCSSCGTVHPIHILDGSKNKTVQKFLKRLRFTGAKVGRNKFTKADITELLLEINRLDA